MKQFTSDLKPQAWSTSVTLHVVHVSTVQEHGQVHRLLGEPMACDQLIQSSLVALKTWLPTHKQKQEKATLLE